MCDCAVGLRKQGMERAEGGCAVGLRKQGLGRGPRSGVRGGRCGSEVRERSAMCKEQWAMGSNLRGIVRP